jgi:hypothetical protein
MAREMVATKQTSRDRLSISSCPLISPTTYTIPTTLIKARMVVHLATSLLTYMTHSKTMTMTPTPPLNTPSLSIPLPPQPPLTTRLTCLRSLWSTRRGANHTPTRFRPKVQMTQMIPVYTIDVTALSLLTVDFHSMEIPSPYPLRRFHQLYGAACSRQRNLGVREIRRWHRL